MKAAAAAARLPPGRGVTLPLAIAGAAFAAPVLLGGDPYGVRLLTVSGVYALLGIGYHLAFGQAGLLSLAHGAFFGLGAYVAGGLALKLGAGAALAVPLAVLGPMLLAAVIALPVLRLASHYFALATLAVAQAVLLVAVNWTEVTGGANGLAGVPALELFGLRIGRGLPLLSLTWALVASGAALAWALGRGRLGLAWQVARSDEIAAAAIGVDVGRLRLAAFLLAAGYAGAAGALQVHSVGVVSPEVLQFAVMVTSLTLVVVGGRLRVAGAILGAVLVVHLPEWFRGLDRHYLVAYGVALLAMIVAAPDGIVGRLEALRARLGPTAEPPLPQAAPLPAARPAVKGPALAADGLEKHFGGVAAVDRVSLRVAPGEILGLIGPNGSGKTTLLNLLSGLERPDRGAVFLAGREVTALPAHRRARAGLARGFQVPRLVPELSVLDNVAAARIGMGAALAPGRAQAMGALERVGLDGVAGRRPETLAPGLLRRAEIARALALQPIVLLLDEPAAGLAPPEQAELAAHLRALAAEGIALVVVEHDMPFLMGLADRMICLDAGHVAAEGTPAEIRADPRVVAIYLGERGEGAG